MQEVTEGAEQTLEIKDGAIEPTRHCQKVKEQIQLVKRPGKRTLGLSVRTVWFLV